MSTPTTIYTLHGDSGLLMAEAGTDLEAAMQATTELAQMCEGRRVWLYRDGRPIPMSGPRTEYLTWTCGTRAGVTR